MSQGNMENKFRLILAKTRALGAAAEPINQCIEQGVDSAESVECLADVAHDVELLALDLEAALKLFEKEFIVKQRHLAVVE